MAKIFYEHPAWHKMPPDGIDGMIAVIADEPDMPENPEIAPDLHPNKAGSRPLYPGFTPNKQGFKTT